MARTGSACKKKQPVTKTLTAAIIRRHVGERSYRRGEQYFEHGAVYDCRREGRTLKAFCHGRSAAYYVVEARVQGGRIADAACSCPVGAGGHCKHVAALLLKWVAQPDEFRPVEPPEVRLARCSKDDLIALITQILQREPELQAWLEGVLPSSGPKKATRATPDSSTYRRQVEAAFQRAGYGWQADHELTTALDSLKTIGDGFRKEKNFLAASAVYCGLLQGFIGGYATFEDETGNVCEVAQQCAKALGDCLARLDEGSEPRQEALQTLFEVLKFDIEFGGIGLSDDIPECLSRKATAEEKRTVAQWIRQALPSKQDSTGWHRATWGTVLCQLEGIQADDERYLEHCRQFGLKADLVAGLLKRGRLEEALAEIQNASDYELLNHADCLVAHKHADLAHRLVRERFTKHKKHGGAWPMRDWLERFYTSRKDWQAALDLAMESFRSEPSFGDYQQVRKYAEKLKTWSTLRPMLMEALRCSTDQEDLIRVHLLEGEVAEAVAALESGLRRQASDWGGGRLALDVAKAAEKNYPQAAAKLYLVVATSLIDQRGRESYRAACKYLKKVRDLFLKLQLESEWNKHLAALRTKYASLRALQQELDQARF